jgi:ATP-binding cassette subfamily C protein
MGMEENKGVRMIIGGYKVEYLLYFTKKLHSFSGKILYMNLLGMMFVSLMEGIGILLLIPMINTSGVVTINNHLTPISEVFEWLHHIPEGWRLPLILFIYILLVVVQVFLQQNLTLQNMKILIGFTNHLRLETYQALLQANWVFFMKKRKSDLISALTGELGRVVNGTNLFLQFFASLIFTIVQVGIAFWLSPHITVFVLISGVFLIYLSRSLIKKANLLGSQTSEIAKSYLGGITDHFNGMKDIKSNTLEESRYNWLRTWCQKVELEQLGFQKIRNRSQFLYKITSTVLIAGFIFMSVKLFKSEPAQLLLIILIFSRLWPRFTSIQSNLEQIAASIPALKALLELQQECNNAVEITNVGQQYKYVKPMLIAEKIECQNVYFRYSEDEPLYALKNINLEIPANRMTAIVGRSGAGKSTLIDLLMGLIQPESGEVLIDGVSLTNGHLLSLRRSISYVPQDPFLFNGSIRENMLMVEQDASEEQIWEALEFSAVADFVKKLPQGLDTLIGDRGVRLSGGERQRLVLARAILRNPAILVLDEATSALDTENEAKIQEALEQLKGKMTILVIAHRLSTIRHADQVIVLDEGRIVQTGKFGQLASEKKGLFSRLLGSQQKLAIRE